MMRTALVLGSVCLAVVIWTPSSAAQSSQGVPQRIADLEARVIALETGPRGLRHVKSVGDRMVDFWEDGISERTGQPEPSPSFPLAPITDEKNFEFETGSTVVPGGTIGTLLQIDVSVQQFFDSRNDGQNVLHVFTTPFVQVESPAFTGVTDPVTGQPLNGVWKFPVPASALWVSTKALVAAGINTRERRGNFGRALISKTGLEARFGPGVGAAVFENDFTVRMSVQNRLQGVYRYAAGTRTQLYGQ